MTLPTLKPLTIEERARINLGQLHEAVNAMSPELLFEYRMAMSELRDWANDYGLGGQIALRVFQLEQTLGVQTPAAH